MNEGMHAPTPLIVMAACMTEGMHAPAPLIVMAACMTEVTNAPASLIVIAICITEGMHALIPLIVMSEGTYAQAPITSWGGTSKLTVLRSTHLNESVQGMRKNSPGP